MRNTVRFGGAGRAGTILRTAAAALLFAAGLAGAQSAASAQPSADSRWTPWLGCWQQTAPGDQAASRVTCNVPVSGAATAIQSLSIVNGKVASRRRIDAGGRAHAIDEAGCSGTETGKFSVVGRRVYLGARYTCAGTLIGSSSTIYAISPAGDWLEMESVNADGGAVDRVVRWHDAGTPDGLPKEITTALAGRQLAITTARAAAARPIRSDDVVEAVRSSDSSTVRAWLAETRQRFALTGPELTVLEHASVPTSVLRAMMGDFGDDQAVVAQQQPLPDFGNDAYLRARADAERQADAMIQNPYSVYNGYTTYSPYGTYPNPYAVYGYGYGYPIGPVAAYPIGSPFVVVHGGRVGRPIRPESHEPVNPGRPIGTRPTGARPYSGAPPAATKPVARIPSRSRP